MGAGALGYLLFGAALVALFVAIVAHYYARSRRSKVEQAKYSMLDDDDDGRPRPLGPSRGAGEPARRGPRAT